jgi:hypothetical protein
MPAFQVMLDRLCGVFGAEGIQGVPTELFDGGRSLPEIAKELGIAQNRREEEIIRGIPDEMQEALRAVISRNLARADRLPITFAWAPAYDYELNLWVVPGTDESRGGITVLFKSRYPDDVNPATRR